MHYLFAINDGLCQVRDPGNDSSLDEHLDLGLENRTHNRSLP